LIRLDTNPIINPELPTHKGNYVLVCHCDTSFEFNHRILGTHLINPGWYLYVGSAHGSGGLRSRILRHLANENKTHWHIDYLKGEMTIRQVWFEVYEANRECAITRTILSVEGAAIPIQGFGASDCREGCPAHLIRFPLKIAPGDVYQSLNTSGMGLFGRTFFRGHDR